MGESGMRWEQAAAEICAAVENIAAKIAHNAANNLYETVMTSVQDYLRENVEFNLSSELQGYADTARRLRDENEQLKRRADLVEPLVEALRIIAGQQQCIDNLMSNADVANAALSSWEAAQ